MKKVKWVVLASIIIVIGLFVGVLIQDEMRHERENRDNDAYEDYYCNDYHLVCKNLDERVGKYRITLSAGEFLFRYGTIEGISDEEFIFAHKSYLLFGYGENMVLQSPENDVDVLNDWHINEVSLYYLDYNDPQNPGTFAMATADKYITYEVASSTEYKLIEQVKEMQLNTDPDGLGCLNNNGYPDYKNVIPSNYTVYIRLHFAEAENIAWDANVEIFQSETNETEFVVTVDKGAINEDYQRERGSYIIPLDSELYRLIVEAYTQGELGRLSK